MRVIATGMSASGARKTKAGLSRDETIFQVLLQGVIQAAHSPLAERVVAEGESINNSLLQKSRLMQTLNN
jgi:hypothetical protein